MAFVEDVDGLEVEKRSNREMVSCLVGASRDDGVKRRTYNGCGTDVRRKLKSWSCDSDTRLVMRGLLYLRL